MCFLAGSDYSLISGEHQHCFAITLHDLLVTPHTLTDLHKSAKDYLHVIATNCQLQTHLLNDTPETQL